MPRASPAFLVRSKKAGRPPSYGGRGVARGARVRSSWPDVPRGLVTMGGSRTGLHPESWKPQRVGWIRLEESNRSATPHAGIQRRGHRAGHRTSHDLSIRDDGVVSHLGLIVWIGAFCAVLGFSHRAVFWFAGGAEPGILPLRIRLREFYRRVILHEGFRPGGWRAPLMHGLLFWGFIGLITPGAAPTLASLGMPLSLQCNSALLLLRELSALAFLAGIAMAIHRRYVRRWLRLPLDLPGDPLALGLLLAIPVTGILSVAARLALSSSSVAYLPMASWLAAGFRSLEIQGATTLLVLQTLHAALVASLLAILPFTRLRHSLVAPLMILFALRKPDPAGEAGLSWAQRMQLDACSACGRCDVACLERSGGKGLSPMNLLLEQRHDVSAHGVSDLTLLHCTQCSECEAACPIGISHRPRIDLLRRKRGLDDHLAPSPT